jgi:hypothetical protein
MNENHTNLLMAVNCNVRGGKGGEPGQHGKAGKGGNGGPGGKGNEWEVSYGYHHEV